MRLLMIAHGVLIGCSPMYLAWRPPIDISDYRGDGAIARLEHPINPGFKIDFEAFSLAAPHQAVYRLEGLPRPRHQSPYEIGLVVELDAGEEARWPQVPAWLGAPALGMLTVRVTGQSGVLLLDFEGRVGGQRWVRKVDDRRLFAVIRRPKGSDTEASRFPSHRKPEAGQAPSVLEVRYTPGPDATPRMASVRIEAGGED